MDANKKKFIAKILEVGAARDNHNFSYEECIETMVQSVGHYNENLMKVFARSWDEWGCKDKYYLDSLSRTEFFRDKLLNTPFDKETFLSYFKLGLGAEINRKKAEYFCSYIVESIGFSLLKEDFCYMIRAEGPSSDSLEKELRGLGVLYTRLVYGEMLFGSNNPNTFRRIVGHNINFSKFLRKYPSLRDPGDRMPPLPDHLRHYLDKGRKPNGY